MRNMMRIYAGDVIHFNMCAVNNCDVVEPEGEIPLFYSQKHAHDSGWKYTTDPKFAPPDECLSLTKCKPVWVCPKCAEKYEWAIPQRFI